MPKGTGKFGNCYPGVEVLLAEKISSLIGRINPERIYTHNPWGEYGHCEHILLNKILSSYEKFCLFPDVALGKISSADAAKIIRKKGLIVREQHKIDFEFRNKVINLFKKSGIWTGKEDNKKVLGSETFLGCNNA